MSVIENSRVSIIGAGAVGSSIAYASLIRGSARTVALYDIDRARAEAEVLDLAHGTLFTGSSEMVGGGDLDVVAGSNIVVITAGAKQKPGQTRLDLAATNVGILEDLLPKLLERAPDAVYLLVTNPVDVLTVEAQRITGLPPRRVFGSGTVLDTSRLRWLLAGRAGVAASSVHAFIAGEHGDSEFALWSQARLGPIPILDWRREGHEPFTEAELERITEEVRGAAYRVIEGKGATNYAIGLAAARIIEAVLRDEKAVLPVSSVLSGYHGISDVALSVPSIVGSGGVEDTLDLALSEREERQLQDSANALRETLAAVAR